METSTTKGSQTTTESTGCPARWVLLDMHYMHYMHSKHASANVCALAPSSYKARSLAMGDQPDVALIDVCLEGGREGIEIARWLREVCDVPIVCGGRKCAWLRSALSMDHCGRGR